jgi:predicted O-linked N-acetylglucosamine transferase (SPINDLY family)
MKRPRKGRDVGGVLARALALHQNGLLADAQVLYKEILRKIPAQFDALHLLGVSEMQIGHLEAAERLMRRAVLVDPRSAPAHSNLGHLLTQTRRVEEALACFDKAIALKADYAEALFNRGHALAELKRFEAAIASYDRAIALKPDFADAENNRGVALRALHRPEEALAGYDRAIALRPGYAEALNNRGTALFDLRRFEEAVASYDEALSLKTDCADVWCNHGEALYSLERFDEALASYDRALAVDPNLVAAWLGRANILRTSRVLEAFAACGRALAIEPNSPRGLTLLGQCHAIQGDSEQAVACYDRALAVKPDDEYALSSKIFALDFSGNAGFARQQAARASWWREIGSPIAARSRLHHDNDPDPARRIVLGYVSSDFKKHSAAFGFSPVLKHHDRTRFEVVCYACSPKEDAVTGYFQQIADKWRSASQWSDDRLADTIRADKVDILIDLSGHSSGNRLRTFARKPAPIQVTAWGHSTGTGLATIDYLFSDPVAIPTAARHLFAEKIHDLPCLVIIEPPVSEQRSQEPPVLSKGHVTYGVFNRIDKISDEAVRVWARILQADVEARLLIKHSAVDDPSVRLALSDRFVRHGISTDRIHMLGASSRPEHIAALEQVDICLDTFPQNGGVSTWEALHVGVPVVAKLGNGVSSRLSGAILSAIGMTEWVAADDDEYAQIALKFASMPDRLRTIRHELPERIATTSGCDPAGYTAAVERAYRTMWEDYCRRAS